MAMRPTPPTSETAAAPPPAAGFSLKPSRQTATLLGVLIAVCLASAGGYYAWQTSEMASLDAQIAARQQQVSESQQIARRLDSTEAEYTNLQGRLGRLETSVSQADYVPTLLKQIERLANDTRLHVDNITPVSEVTPPPAPVKEGAERKRVAPPPPYDKEHIKMDVHGKYWDIARFVYRLSEFPKILSVDGVDFAPQGDKPDVSPEMRVSLTMTGYLFKNTPPPAPSPSPGFAPPTVPAAPTLPARPTI